jgi:hypothetical protein
MRSFLFLHSLATLITFSALTNAYKVSIYSGQSCRGQGLGNRDIAPDIGCQRDFSGVGASAVISVSEGNTDFVKVVVFPSGDDCKPSEIMHDDGCWTGNYGSYEVWDLWLVEGMDAPALN